MRKLLTLAIPIVLGVGVLAAMVNDPEDGDLAAARNQGGVVTEKTLPAVIEVPATSPSTTSTTAAPAPAPEPETTTTTAAAPTTTTTARRVTAPAPRPRPAPTTTTTTAPAPPPQTAAPAMVDCGTGSASARSMLRYDTATRQYFLEAAVTNDSTKDIELDRLVVRARYGTTERTYAIDVAGRIVAARPGVAEVTFAVPDSRTEAQPDAFEIAEFRFHTAGLPECSSH